MSNERPTDSHIDPHDERPVYHAFTARAMDCNPSKFGHAEGERVITLTVAKSIDIETLAFPIEDAKFMVTKMLIALATYDDDLAETLLHDHFFADAEGNFIWPSE